MLRPDWRAGGGMATVGLEIVVSIAFGYLGGRWLDGRLDTAPVLAIVGAGFGLAAAARFVWRAARRMRRQMERDGFKASATGRDARFALEARENERKRRDEGPS